MLNNNLLLAPQTVTFHPYYAALINYAKANAINIPDRRTQIIQNDFFYDIDSILAKGVTGYLLAGDATRREFAYLNIFNPGTHTAVNGAATPNYGLKGINGNGTTQYVNTTWNPSTEGGGLFTQDDGTIICFINSDVTGAMLDYGASDGTSQIAMNSRASSPSNTARFIHNNNSNIDLSVNVISNGLYMTTRTSGSNVQIWKDAVTSANSSTSLGTTNAEMYLLARNSSGTANNFSSRSMGFWAAFDGLTDPEKLVFRNAWLNYYNRQQDPLFIVTDDQTVPDEIVGIVPATWESNQIFGIALYPNPLQNIGAPQLIYYSGNNSAPGEGRENDVGIFHLTTPNSGTKDPGNPVLERGDIGLGGGDEGFTPMATWVDGSTIYIFGSVYESANDEINIGYITAPVSDPTDFSSPNFTRVITAGGTGHFNHGCHVFLDPDDPTILLMAYAHRNVTANILKINIAEADLTDLDTWTVRHTDIWQSSLAGSNQVYPFVFWDADESKYYLFSGRFSGVIGGQYFTIFSTESATLGNLDFPEGRETLWPTGISTDFDAGYTSVPRPDLARGKIYYCGRDLSAGDGSYLGIGVKNIQKD